MAKVPLRQYTRDIENLIDRGQTEEALAHCKSILQTYPKCIGVYRLLGKAYLETQRYSEAADILQRVLSSVPDDFVSHVGMSIIREDEGNLGSAVWHMERAYEAQPSNGAVQEELRRLIGRRDGTEPPKIRMTRGALVRMYARGHLYEQAIAEVRAALDEDSSRTDLQVILARLYAQTGAKIEATSLCSELITKSPYCFEANLILSEVFTGSSRSENVAVYRQRVIDLDPYMEFVSSEKTIDEVAEQAVMIEKVEWDPSSGEGSQPGWAASLGVSMEPDLGGDHVLPEWLASISSTSHLPPKIEPKSQQPTAFTTPGPLAAFGIESEKSSIPASEPPPNGHSPEAAPSQDNADLPGWMKDAGWISSAGEARGEPFVFNESEASEEAVMNTELPEWLRSLAPSEALEDQEGDAAEAAEQFAWLDNIGKENAVTPYSSVEDVSSSSPQDWLPPEPEPTSEPFPEPFESIQPTPLEEISREEAVPEWLQSMQVFQPESDDSLTDGAPEIPEWMAAEEPVTPTGNTQESLAPLTPGKEDTMAWLESLAEEHNAEAPTLVIRPSDRVSQPPSWIGDLEEEEANAALGTGGTDQPQESPIAEEIGVSELTPEEQEHVDSLLTSNGETIPMPDGEPPFTPAPSDIAAGEPVLASPLHEDGFPDWLLALASEPEASMDAAEVEPVAQQPQAASEAEPFHLPEPDRETVGEELAALAWLDHLSATTLKETPASDEGPKQPAAAEIASAWTKENIEPIPEPAAADQQDALEAIDQGQPAELPEAEPEAAEIELPAWLSMMNQPDAEEEKAALTDELAAVEAGEDLQEDWVKESSLKPEMVEVSPAAEAIQPVELADQETPVEEEIPAWLKDLDQMVNEIEPSAATAADVEPAGAPETAVEPIPEWLQALNPVQPEAEAAIQEPESLVPVTETSAEPESVLQTLVAEGEITGIPETVELSQVETVELIQEEIPAHLQTTEDLTAPVETWIQPVDLEAPGEEIAAEPQAAIVELEVSPADTLAETAPVEIIEPPEYSVQKAPAEPDAVEEFLTAETQPVEEMVQVPVQDMLSQAQQAMQEGNPQDALVLYEKVIRSGESLEETIHDLRDALYRYPVDTSLWELLGDAYLRSNCLQDALNAYTKAEEFIR